MNDNVNRKVLKASGITAVIFVSCLILCLLLELTVAAIAGKIEFIDAGERWSADGERYAVVSMYAEESSGVSYDQVTQWAYSIDAALLSESITPSEKGRSWTWCSAAQTTMTFIGPMGKSTVELMAVSGDFFVVHPMKFTYGSAFLNDNSLPMGVVLDREAAWDLFGTENVIGMEIEAGGQAFTVVGIVEKESRSGMYAYTYGERPRIYMNYAGYAKISGHGSNITVFEAVLPNAVSSFAKNIFTGVVRTNEETTTLLESSDRFSLENRFEGMKQLPYSWIRSNKIEFPYWENEARAADFACAVMMIFEVGFAAVGVVSMLLSFILLRTSGYTFTDTVKNVYRKIEKQNSKKTRQKSPKKYKKPTTDSKRPSDIS